MAPMTRSRGLVLANIAKAGATQTPAGALQSLYSDNTLQVNIAGRVGQPYQSRTGLKQGCPLSPTLFELFAYGLHRYIKVHCPAQGPALEADVRVPILGYAEDFVLLTSSPGDPQRLNDAAAAFCDAIGMIICVVKTQTMVFAAQPMPAPPWRCKGLALQQVGKFKYLGITSSATRGMQATLPSYTKDDCSIGASRAAIWQLGLHLVCRAHAQGV